MRQPSCIVSGWDGKLFWVKSSERFVFGAMRNVARRSARTKGREKKNSVGVSWLNRGSHQSVPCGEHSNLYVHYFHREQIILLLHWHKTYISLAAPTRNC